MKTLLNLGNGALVVSQDSGKLKVTVSKAATLGGGKAAGIVSAEGEGSVVIDEIQGFELLKALVEAHVPAALAPAIDAGATLAEGAIRAL